MRSPRRRDDVAFVLGLALGVGVIVAFGFVERRAELLHLSDFSGVWAGARAMLEGSDPYDAATWHETALRLGTQPPDTGVYGYPPWAAVAFLPLALLPLSVASWLWQGVTMALAALAVRALLARHVAGLPIAHTLAGLTLLASQPALTAFVVGQWSFLLVAANAALLLWIDRAPARAGVTALAMLAKPQLFLVHALAVGWHALRRRRWSFIVVAGGAGLLLVAVAWALAPQWLSAYDTYARPNRLADPPRSAVLAAAAYDAIGRPGIALAYLAIAAVVVLAIRFGTAGPGLALWLVASLVAAPYSWSYDQLLLLVPLVVVAGALARRSAREAMLLVLAGTIFLLFGSGLLYALAIVRHRETFTGIVPILFFALFAAALLRARAFATGDA